MNARNRARSARIRPEQAPPSCNTAGCRSCKRQLAEEEKHAEEAKDSTACCATSVTEDEIARIVSRWTGIPVTKLVEGEREKLLQLDRHPASSA